MKRKTNVEGFSLVEMVVAMGILSIFIPTMVSMMVTATTARNVAIQTSKNSSSSSAISSVLENDIKRSGTFDSQTKDGGKIYVVKMAQADGKCVAWRVHNGLAQRIETDGTKLTKTWVFNWNNAQTFSDKANFVGNEESFTWIDGTRNQGRLQYKIQLGDKNAASIIENVVLPEVTGNGKGYCW